MDDMRKQEMSTEFRLETNNESDHFGDEGISGMIILRNIKGRTCK